MESTDTPAQNSRAEPVRAAAWFAIQSKPRQAQRAAQHLGNQGYHCYLPLINNEKLHKGRRQQVAEPLFPGYLFIRLCPGQDNWQPIRSTRGVLRLVAFAGRPVPVEDAIVAGIQARLARENAEPNAHAALSPGDAVRIKGLEGELEGLFQRYDGEERVIILLNLLQRQQQLSVAISDIEKA